MPSAGEKSRRERILDAAEVAFADLGFAGAHVRRIGHEARVNAAMVYYYFGSKMGLAEAVLERRFGPLRRGQCEALQRARAAARGTALPVEKILEAMLRPPLGLAGATPSRREVVGRLIGRVFTEPNPRTQERLRRQGTRIRAAIFEALRESLPELPPTVLRWRMEFVRGALAFSLSNLRRIERESGGACDTADTDRILAEMMAFFLGGIRAPAPTG